MASKQNTATTLENARKALAQIEQEAEGLVAARDKVLLDGGATSEAIEINKQIDATRRAVEAEQRRVHLLEQRVAQEEVEAAAQRHAKHVDEFEKVLGQADVAGDRLQAAAELIEREFRETIRLRELALSMWPHGRSSHGDALAKAPEGAAMAGGAVSILLQHELHRVGFESPLGGRPGEKVKIPLPGGAPERLTPLVDPKTKRPVPLVPLAEKLRNASRFAVETMRNDAFTPAIVPQPEPVGPRLVFDERAVAPVQQEPARQQVIKPAAPAPAQPQPPAAGDVDPLREYIPPIYREPLAALLRQQMQAAASGDDQLYEKSVSDMVALRKAIDEAKQQGEDAA